MLPSNPFSTEEPEQGLSRWSLGVADALVEAGDEGVSLADLQRDVTQYAEDKITALRRQGFVIAEDHDLEKKDGRVYVLVVDPRQRRLAA